MHFGYTNCPEVCPTTLSEVADVMDALGRGAGQVRPIFISIDPERDSPPKLADYTAAFHPSILGLTGTPDSLKAAAESFHIFYFLRSGDATAPDRVAIEHSPTLFLFGPDGAWLRAYAFGTPAAKISADLLSRLE